MSRQIPDAMQHITALSGVRGLADRVARVHAMVVQFGKDHVTLYEKGYQSIVVALQGSGYDVSRGFRIGNARVSVLVEAGLRS